MTNQSRGKVGEEDIDPTLQTLTTLGLRISDSLKYLYREQGVNLRDILWVLHGVMGQVLSWSPRPR